MGNFLHPLFSRKHESIERNTPGESARPMLNTYADAVDKGEPFETVATDFLTDLFHLIASEGHDPGEMVVRALGDFAAEHNDADIYA